MDSFNYAPPVRAPVLMMNGRYDALFPYETAQLPLLHVLGRMHEHSTWLTRQFDELREVTRRAHKSECRRALADAKGGG